MRALALDSFEAPPALRDLPEPAPAAGEVLIRVHASSVNGVDAAIAAGLLKEMVEHRLPVALGRDFAGVVEALGEGAGRYRVGDEVFGFLPAANPAVHDGSWSELVTAPEDDFLAPRPGSLDLAHAGAAPLAALTALAALDALAPARDETVLVVGASGGVGSFFVQLAASAGARVIAPGLPDDADYLRGLGAAEVPDRGADLDGGVDAILDLVSFAPSDALLAEGGRLASPLGAAGDGPGRFNLMAQSTPESLRRLAGLLDDGTLSVPIQRSYELAEAGEALRAFSTTHLQGKLGIVVA